MHSRSRSKRFALPVLAAALVCLVLDASGAQTKTGTPEQAAAAAQSGDDFVSVDLAAQQSVNGKMLMIAAYCIILGVLVLYSFSVLRRERTIKEEIADLLKRLKGGRG